MVDVEGLGIKISTGTMAKQANGSVTISLGDTNLLVTATAAGALRDGQDFFTLTVDYRETYSAAGRFPGGTCQGAGGTPFHRDRRAAGPGQPRHGL